MASYAILRIEKLKLGAVTKIGNHHERLKKKYKSNPDIDPERTQFNYHLREPGGKYRQLALARIREAGARKRKDSVILQDCIATASNEWIDALSPEQQRIYFEHAYEFFCKTFGEENIISAVVHMDEAHPHMHLCFVPITKDNRLCSKDIIGGPNGLSKLQDEYYAHMVEKFPDLNRGISRKITHRKHIPTQFYKNADLLMEHYEEITRAINDIGLVGNAKKKDAAIELLGRYAPEMAQMKSQLKTTDKHINELEAALKDVSSLAYNRQDQIYEQEKEINQLKGQLTDLYRKQQKLEKEIKLIPPELLDRLKKDERQRRRKAEREER